MVSTFHEQFDQHGAWRREFALRLKLLGEWLRDHDLLDTGVQERLQVMEHQMRGDKVMVAFVAEFSRGKSELINALFFADYGRRIMPASAGRTTMCPTELGYDADMAPCLRLLPIETRLQPQGLQELRGASGQWTQIALDIQDPQQLSDALSKVAEVRVVSLDEARALGFWDDATPDENPLPLPDGQVEVPRWRHAVINYPHPLLRQGLIVLDTPGLNAVGAEPELTVGLIPQAHAVLFILGCDTGVTRSDLAIWREHLADPSGDAGHRLVVLNKIDTLWDALSTDAQVQAQIDRQCAVSAQMLGVPPQQVMPVSAQKALLAKVTKDTALLEASRIAGLEASLAQMLLGRRQAVLRAAVASGVAGLRQDTSRLVSVRRRDLAEQTLELKGLRGKNTAVIRHMRARIEQEQGDFDAGGARIQAIRAVHLKLLRDLIQLLGTARLKVELADLSQVLRQPGIKLGVRRAYGEAFGRLREGMDKAQAIASEIESMLGAIYQQLNTEFGFQLQPHAAPDVSRFKQELDAVEASHTRYLGLGGALKLAQPEFAERLVRALGSRVRVIYEQALNEVELWSKSASAQLDTQLRERRRAYGRRTEAIDRIQEAADGLERRIAEIEGQDAALTDLQAKLDGLTDYLIQGGPRPFAAVPSAGTAVDIEIAA